MKVAFVLPSCNYNLCLSREELEELITKSHVTTLRPSRVPGYFLDEHGVRRENIYHELDYTDKSGRYPVQFLTINVEKEEPDNGGA